MSSSWLIWVFAGGLILVAGFGVALVPRLRARASGREVAWSTARAAIESATVSRDACVDRPDAAAQALARAEAILAHGGGARAARTATEQARRADRLWRAAAGE
ncbi:hypothetical protein SAMN05216207_1001450 [Pseudonocardia ammonioxydans]|uniref:Uncharacterized protein n=1 Tax=Pseudonocardia ammonioxydans TaxID=260086 RepID=A0A1I4SI25_PSUAM|nr:DUF6403 family protein [Pseudonocardia ammonioxydans]SFM64099.1 hypothetical protein SAMN05216207_1001450 [Pseudonocardia ammonioxydans]